MNNVHPPKPKSRRRRRRRRPRGGAQPQHAAQRFEKAASASSDGEARAFAAPPAPSAGDEAAPGFRLNPDDPFGMCDPAAEALREGDDDDAPDAYWPEEAEEVGPLEPCAEKEEAEAPLVLSTVVADDSQPASAPQTQGFGADGRVGQTVRIPRIVVHACCERAEVAETIAAAARDPRLARVEFTIESGGLDGAIAQLARAASPDLLIIDTTLARTELLRRLEKLADVVFEETRVIIVGAVNDITLFRELTARGVSDYVVTPVAPRDFADALCALYADASGAAGGGRVIAVTGARGGVGASSLARNIAWSIAERQDAAAALIDLDLQFSAAAPAPAAQFTIADALQALETIDEEDFEQFGTLRGRRLRVLGARSSLTREIDIHGEAIGALIAHMRRTSPYVVLDLPHLWTPWTVQMLAGADRAVIVAVRDLASLRNAKNMIEALKGVRDENAAAPDVVLSMVGMPGRPEIPVKDMIEVLGVAPIASAPFDAYAFGAGDAEGLMVDECAPGSRAAHAIDALASQLTGRKIVRRVRGKAVRAAPLVLTPPVETILPPPPRRRREDFTAALPASSPGRAPPAAAVDPVVIEASAAKPEPLPAAAPKQAPMDGVEAAPAACEPIPPARCIPLRAPAPGDIARYTRALEHMGAGRARKGATLLRAVAENGLAPAQHRLAQAYARGEGVDGDFARARHWAARAAEAGHVQAMHDLGVFCLRGEGGARDDATALRWFSEAARFGHRDSQYNLGRLHQEGRGVRANADEALYWFLLAARQGDVVASGRAAEVAFQLTMARIEAVQARVGAFRPAAANVEANEAFAPQRDRARRRA